jgi:hypothetical protein
MKAQPTCGTKTLRDQKFTAVPSSSQNHPPLNLTPSLSNCPQIPHLAPSLYPQIPTSRAQAKPYPQPSADLRCTSRAGLSLIPPPCCTSGLRPRCGLPSSVPSLLPPGTGCHPALQPVYSRSPVVRTTAGHQQVRPLPPQGRVALLLPPQGQVAL